MARDRARPAEGNGRSTETTGHNADLGEAIICELTPVEFAALLVLRATDAFGVSDAAIVTRSDLGEIHLLQVTGPGARRLELFGARSHEGPSADCCRSGTLVAAPDLEDKEAVDRWPRLAAVARSAGIRAIYSVPIHVGGRTIGALDLLCARPRELNAADLAAARAFADIAGSGLSQSVAAYEARIAESQLREALASRIVIEQAKGIIAERYQLDVGEAFGRLRRYARSRRCRLSDLAAELVSRVTEADPPTV